MFFQNRPESRFSSSRIDLALNMRTCHRIKSSYPSYIPLIDNYQSSLLSELVPLDSDDTSEPTDEISPGSEPEVMSMDRASKATGGGADAKAVMSSGVNPAWVRKKIFKFNSHLFGSSENRAQNRAQKQGGQNILNLQYNLEVFLAAFKKPVTVTVYTKTSPRPLRYVRLGSLLCAPLPGPAVEVLAMSSESPLKTLYRKRISYPGCAILTTSPPKGKRRKSVQLGPTVAYCARSRGGTRPVATRQDSLT
ncbi:hypothetical protein B0H17DRAFT_1132010 [Mycena rosella]|uniref:Uncharacterized protein n=1 Tax=Mycena rosella TaxID=1033263 RepID=A0AAD7DLV6_MYCRO|nr:hypothetical protein B0H17DRAFT_1132010 [Mycena rosella]